MKKIGGNLTGVIQQKTSTKNAIGETENAWTDCVSLFGYLDMSNNQTGHQSFNAKIQDSTHMFLSDYVDLDEYDIDEIRMMIKGKVYEVLLIDNPMELDEHLEIYLQYIGAQQ